MYFKPDHVWFDLSSWCLSRVTEKEGGCICICIVKAIIYVHIMYDVAITQYKYICKFTIPIIYNMFNIQYNLQYDVSKISSLHNI